MQALKGLEILRGLRLRDPELPLQMIAIDEAVHAEHLGDPLHAMLPEPVAHSCSTARSLRGRGVLLVSFEIQQGKFRRSASLDVELFELRSQTFPALERHDHPDVALDDLQQFGSSKTIT